MHDSQWKEGIHLLQENILICFLYFISSKFIINENV